MMDSTSVKSSNNVSTDQRTLTVNRQALLTIRSIPVLPVMQPVDLVWVNFLPSVLDAPMIVSSFEIQETGWIKMSKSLDPVNAGKTVKNPVPVIHSHARMDSIVIHQWLGYHLNAQNVHQKITALHVADLWHLTVCPVRPTWNVPM